MLPSTLTNFLVPFLNVLSLSGFYNLSPSPQSLQFELRHLHAISRDAHVVFSDVQPRTLHTHADSQPPKYTVRPRRISSFRPPSFEAFTHARIRSMRFSQSERLHWDEEEIMAPDVESRETLLELAKMTNNAYVAPDDPEWYDLGGGWDASYPFGWEPDADGFRGHVFATPDNKTVILSIKGTSAGVFGGGGPTVRKDKFNDNLLFSCCCARIDWSWKTVFECHPQSPDSTMWIIGHSLGGALATLLGATFGAPAVAFESPGERMASRRLHLPSPPSTHHITHIYHSADPIAMGTCNGVLSSCALAGYAMEARCHLGKTIFYDTVSNLQWAVDIRTHGIVNVIEKLLSEPWGPSVEIGREVPEMKEENDCVECYSWEFGDFPTPSSDSRRHMINMTQTGEWTENNNASPRFIIALPSPPIRSMIIPINIASSSSNPKLPPGLAKISHDEVVLIELQGSLEVECNHISERDGKLVGKLKVDAFTVSLSSTSSYPSSPT
ncbi:hypothetical protein D9615_010102 [Tricholomella constricta]|uniref:triacylglycerol lipase n=1 Tax=Tricholomella constricta TaxID=117010 RepID=A0A8H5LX41_9AGAR|nr:hypothetical protein D9615_010102 [Tricholomella constricta]